VDRGDPDLSDSLTILVSYLGLGSLNPFEKGAITILKSVVYPFAAWFGSVLVAVLIGAMTAKRNTEIVRADAAVEQPPTKPAKHNADHELCYLCGKPLQPNELASRVCQTCS
jgi:hypothetical protein